ncbi:hypothetical protein ONZ45_g9409 [Pleurotus djamor]|nr:hypothetical protein ONZ45_g9409 [Pleurotus djamor]
MFACLGIDWKGLLQAWAALEKALDMRHGRQKEDGLPHVVPGLPKAISRWVQEYCMSGGAILDDFVPDAGFLPEMQLWWKSLQLMNDTITLQDAERLSIQPWMKRGGRGMMMVLLALKMWGMEIARKNALTPESASVAYFKIVCHRFKALFTCFIKPPSE